MFIVVRVMLVICVVLVEFRCSWLRVKKFMVICVMVMLNIVMKFIVSGCCRWWLLIVRVVLWFGW